MILLSRGRHTHLFLSRCRDAALQQRSDDDGTLCTLCGIGMAALCAGDDAIGADDDVAVKVGINFDPKRRTIGDWKVTT